MLSFFPLHVLDEIWDVIESVSERFLTYSPKRMLKQPCSNCKFKCGTVFTEENRQKIFDSFWSLGAYERQNDFICSSAEEKKTKKTRTYL